MESANKELYKMSNNWIQESYRNTQLTEKCQRYREKYQQLKAKYDKLHKFVNSVAAHPVPPANAFFNPLLNNNTTSTPSSFQQQQQHLQQQQLNFSLLHQPSSGLLADLSSGLSMQLQGQGSLSRVLDDEHDSVKDFHGACGGFPERLMSEASTSR